MAGNTEYKNKFISENYDRIFLTVPKGTKALIEAKAKAEGMSVNSNCGDRKEWNGNRVLQYMPA